MKQRTAHIEEHSLAEPKNVFRKFAWVMNGMLGANAYRDYVAHQKLHHPEQPLMTEKEFWRWHADDQDKNPGARCC